MVRSYGSAFVTIDVPQRNVADSRSSSSTVYCLNVVSPEQLEPLTNAYSTRPLLDRLRGARQRYVWLMECFRSFGPWPMRCMRGVWTSLVENLKS